MQPACHRIARLARLAHPELPRHKGDMSRSRSPKVQQRFPLIASAKLQISLMIYKYLARNFFEHVRSRSMENQWKIRNTPESAAPEGWKQKHQKCEKLQAAHQHIDHKKPLHRVRQQCIGSVDAGGAIAQTIAPDAG